MTDGDDKLPWTGLFNIDQIARLKEAFPNFVICPVYTSRFGSADEAGTVYVMGANSDFYHAKKILARWYEKTTGADEGDKVKWWLRVVEEKGLKPVMSHDILDGLSHARWTEYVASYKRLAAAHHQRTYHARKKAAIIKAKQEDHRAARDLLGLAGPGDKKAGPSASGSGGG